MCRVKRWSNDNILNIIEICSIKANLLEKVKKCLKRDVRYSLHDLQHQIYDASTGNVRSLTHPLWYAMDDVRSERSLIFDIDILEFVKFSFSLTN
jgi:hypothetical protein